MTEITRFEMDMDGSMEPSEHGEWVRYEDAQRELDSQYKLGMEAERSRQHDEIERLTNLCYEYLRLFYSLTGCKTDAGHDAGRVDHRVGLGAGRKAP
jgi:hypothetical protein